MTWPIYLQSDLWCLYKLNCNLFNHHERLDFFSQHQPPAILHFFLLVVIAGDCAMTWSFHVLQKICHIKNIITIYLVYTCYQGISTDVIITQGSLLLTWINLIPAWISTYIHYKVWDEITYPFRNFNYCSVEVWEWINDFISHFMIDAIIYRCWDLNWSILVNGVPGNNEIYTRQTGSTSCISNTTTEVPSQWYMFRSTDMPLSATNDCHLGA